MRHLPVVLLLACGSPSAAPTDDTVGGDTTTPACPDATPLRRPLYGDLHVHTRYSFDAAIQRTRVGPDQAYAFATGAQVTVGEGAGARTVQLDRPLDFTAITDHAEYLGETAICTDPADPPGSDAQICDAFDQGSVAAVGGFGYQNSIPDPERNPDICGEDGARCAEASAAVWDDLVRAAEDAYDPCAFTSFLAYEWTSIPDLSVLHRNVIFRGSTAPSPFSHFEAPSAEALWDALTTACLEAGTGCDVLAIPHNSNQSNGRAFLPAPEGVFSDEGLAALYARRAALEPVMEVYQHKGDSECMNGLSGFLGAEDELCAFEKLRREPVRDCGEEIGANGQLGLGCFSARDFLRGALLTGLDEEGRTGVNPFQLGVIGSTDTHNGTPGRVAEDAYIGHIGRTEDEPAEQLADAAFVDGGLEFSPGGLAGVWAPQNTRDAIFDAIRRRETFGTSGPRLQIRTVAAWDLPADLCDRDDPIAAADPLGVPMGGRLAAPPTAAAPRLFVQARHDAEGKGTPLQRLQIIKGWRDDEGLHTTVFDVAGDPDNGATVDLDTCTPQGAGFETLCAVWQDPAFDPEQAAFYYARVLENPTCRWSQHTCTTLAVDDLPPACFDPPEDRTVQERAWSSPVWFTP